MTLLQAINCTILPCLLVMVGAGLIWVGMHSEKAQDESDSNMRIYQTCKYLTTHTAVLLVYAIALKENFF